MKEKKNNPKLAVNIMQEIEKETMHQECFIPPLLMLSRVLIDWQKA